MDRQRIHSLILDTYAKRRAGDVEAILEAFHPDGVFEMAAAESPIRVKAQGHGDIRAALTGLVDAFEFVEQHPIDVMIDGNKAAVHARATVRFVPNGKVFITDYVDLWTFDGDKVVAFREFVDTALIVNVMRA